MTNKKDKKRKKSKKKKINYYCFIKTRNITATIYFLLMIMIALLILLGYFGIIDFNLWGW